MAKTKKRPFLKGMRLYAVIFLHLTIAGLIIFWNFIDSYEQSRPKNTMDSYLAALTPARMVEKTDSLALVDLQLQSKAECTEVIQDSLTGKISYARKSSVCTDTSQTYVLRCGSQVIGEVEIRAGEPDLFGFTVWSLAEERFDFSHLLCEEQTITVPSNYHVFANDEILAESYISEQNIHYPSLEEFYQDYSTLPTMVTYSVGPVLGELELEVMDTAGRFITDWEDVDLDTLLESCSSGDKAMLESFMDDFLEAYVRFTGSNKKNATGNYYKLLNNYLISGSPLAQRLYTALDGLFYSQNHSDKLMRVEINRIVQTEESRYFCDATYAVSTLGNSGTVETVNNVKVILLMTDKGLRVEAMTRY